MKTLHDGTEVSLDTPTKLVGGLRYLLTQEEIDARNAETAATEAKAITDHISVYRRQRENGGVDVLGATIRTDTESRANLLGAAQMGITINWKAENGFFEFTAQEMQTIAAAVGAHIQKCFSAEKAVSAAHAQSPYQSKEAIETAFDNAYSS